MTSADCFLHAAEFAQPETVSRREKVASRGQSGPLGRDGIGANTLHEIEEE